MLGLGQGLRLSWKYLNYLRFLWPKCNCQMSLIESENIGQGLGLGQELELGHF